MISDNFDDENLTSPECNSELSIRLGKMGKFVGCTNYPKCSYTRNIDSLNKFVDLLSVDNLNNRSCPLCTLPLTLKHGRYGKFIGCTGYPNCKFIEPLNKPQDIFISCPLCYEGKLMKRIKKRGSFYSCNKYPDCKYILNDLPISDKCPICSWSILTLKAIKSGGKEKVCPQKSCSYVKKVNC